MKMKFINGSTKGMKTYLKKVSPFINGALKVEELFNVDDLEKRTKEKQHEHQIRKNISKEIS